MPSLFHQKQQPISNCAYVWSLLDIFFGHYTASIIYDIYVNCKKNCSYRKLYYNTPSFYESTSIIT